MNTFLRSGLIVLVLSNFASLVNYGFLILVTRKLGPSNYSVVASVAALGPSFFGIFSIIPQIISKALIYVEKNKKERILVLNITRQIIAAVLLFLLFIYLLLSKDLLQFLKLNSYYPLYIYLVSVTSSVTMLYNTGRLQAIQCFVPISFKDFSFSFLKIILALLLLYYLSLSIYGALMADAVTSLIVAIAMYIYTNRKEKIYLRQCSLLNETEFVDLVVLKKSITRFIIPSIAVSWLSGILLSVDIYFSKHFLPPSEAGLYSAASSIGHISLFFSGSLGAILFPKVLKNRETGVSSTKDLASVAIITGSASILISIVLSFFGEDVIRILYGSKYIGCGQIVAIISWAMTFLSITVVIFNFFLAREKYSFIFPAILIVAMMTALIYYFLHNSSIQIALGLLLGVSLLFVVSAFLLLPMRSKK